MQTTIVYILVSSRKDLYLEQLWCSLYSVRLHNPEARIVLMTDDNTAQSLVGNRAKIKEYLSEVKVIDVPAEYSPKERSRYIKTTFRSCLKGNLLFMDTDTIIADDLSSIDLIDEDVACVLDLHAPLSQLKEKNQIRQRMIELFGLDVSQESNYFNSGVLFVKDTPKVQKLFEQWHKNWKHSAFEKNTCLDQPALMASNIACGHVIKELPGIWNCQVLGSIQYLHHAKVIHFFNVHWEGKHEFSPFFDEETYQQIKKLGDIPNEIKKYIEDPKSAFFSPTYFACNERYEFMRTPVGITLYNEFRKNGLLYKFVKILCSIRIVIINQLVKPCKFKK